MNEPDTFIVSVTNDERSFEEDMELPSVMPVSELCQQILMILKDIHEELFTGWVKCHLEHNGRVLRDDDTLVKAGVYDGSRLVVRQ